MTEQPPTSQPEESVDPSATAEPLEESTEPLEPAMGEQTSTGVPAVDEVLRDVDDLDRLPLEEHLGRFERSHEALRSALDADPIEPGDPAGRCRRDACGWTRSWSAAGWHARATMPPS